MSGSATKMTSKELCAMTHTCTDNGDGTHTVQACDVCGAAESTKVHTYNTDKTCECGATVSVTCIAPYATDVVANYNSTYAGVITDADGTTYSRIVGKGANTQMRPKIDINAAPGAAEYIVFKIRTNRTDATGFNFYFAYDANNAASGSDRDYTTVGTVELNAANGEWVYYVLDASLMAKYYAAPTTKTIVSVNMLIEGGSTATADTYLDVGFFALCETKEQVLALIDADTIAYQANGKATTTVNKTAFCPETHSYTYTSKGHQIAACETCGAEAGALMAHTFDTTGNCACGYDSSVVHLVPNATGIVVNYNSTFSGVMVDADGTTYGRAVGNGNNTQLRPKVDINVAPGAAEYIVFKIRTNKTDATSLNFYAAYDANNAINSSTDRDYASLGAAELNTSNGEWMTFIVDASYFAKYYADPSNKTIVSINWLYEGGSVADASTYIDVSYFAFCATKDDVATLVDTENVCYKGKINGQNQVMKTLSLADWLAQ